MGNSYWAGASFKPKNIASVGPTEYCAPQREGKSTMMMCDYVCKILPWGYKPEDTFSNFFIDIEGVNCLNNEAMIKRILKAKYSDERNKVFLFDEVGQELTARGFRDAVQTEVVSFAWQMPKMGHILLWCSNPGNSGDVILRDATWYTVMTKYHKGMQRRDDFIEASVIFNYELKIQTGLIVTGFQDIQDLFDSLQPIR